MGGFTYPDNQNAVTLQGRPLAATAPAVAQVIAWDGATWKPTAPGGGGSAAFLFTVSLPGQASSTIGQLSKANTSTANPGGQKSTTSAGDPGINNGGPDPFIAPKGLTITKAVLKIAHAAVSTGTFSNPAAIAFDVYRVDYSTRTLLGTINFACTNADIFNNLGSNRFATYAATGLAIGLLQGDCFGVEFRNQAGNAFINALGGIWLSLEAS